MTQSPMAAGSDLAVAPPEPVLPNVADAQLLLGQKGEGSSTLTPPPSAEAQHANTWREQVLEGGRGRGKTGKEG